MHLPGPKVLTETGTVVFCFRLARSFRQLLSVTQGEPARRRRLGQP